MPHKQSCELFSNLCTSRLAIFASTAISCSSRQKFFLGTTQSQLQLVRLHSVLSSAKPTVFCPILIDLGGIEPPAGSCEPAGTSHDLIVAGFWIAKLQRKTVAFAAVFKTAFGISKCNLSRVFRDPCRARPLGL